MIAKSYENYRRWYGDVDDLDRYREQFPHELDFTGRRDAFRAAVAAYPISGGWTTWMNNSRHLAIFENIEDFALIKFAVSP